MAEFLAVIPARAGSTRLIDKNLRVLGGRPLVSLAVECACAVQVIREIIVSSDSEAILWAAISGAAGQDDPRVVLHRRDEVLSGTESKIEPLLQELMVQREWATHVILLNPTSPFRDPATIVRCILAVTNLGHDCVATVSRETGGSYAWDRLGGCWVPPFLGPRPRNQDVQPALVEHGACYISSRAAIEAGSLFAGSCYPVTTSPPEEFDIDDEYDLAAARGIWDAFVAAHGVAERAHGHG